MNLFLLTAFFLIAPYFIILLTQKFKILNKIGAVLLCYALGLTLGLTDILPKGSNEIQDIITSATVPLSLPLLLFSSKIKTWKKLAKKSLLSMLLAIIALSIVVCVSYLIFGDKINNANKIGGLLIGLYTGGTPNLASIQTALDVSPETYLMVNTYDLMLSSIFLLLIMSTGGRFLKHILPSYKSQKTDYNYNITYIDEKNPYKDFFKRNNLRKFSLAFIVSILIVAASIGISVLTTQSISMLVVILCITTFSLIGSLQPKINSIEKSYAGGMYLILVFSVTVASMVKLDDFINISPYLFWFVCTILFGTLSLHILFSSIFKIDSDTTLITSTAMICSPPFVPVVAGTLNNKEIIASGLTIGIIGYAVGNYLGYLAAQLLSLITI